VALLLPGAENPKRLRARAQKIIDRLLGSFRTAWALACSRLDPSPHGFSRIRRRGVEADPGFRREHV